MNTCCSSPSQPSDHAARRPRAAPSRPRCARRLSRSPSSSIALARPAAARATGRRSPLAVARELEQVVDDARGAEGLALDLLQDLVARIALGGVREQHLGVARDAGDRRVDLVGDAGRQHAEGRQAVLLLERVLHRHPLGDVVDDEDAQRPSPVRPRQVRAGEVGERRAGGSARGAVGRRVAVGDLDRAPSPAGGQRLDRQHLGERRGR